MEAANKLPAPLCARISKWQFKLSYAEDRGEFSPQGHNTVLIYVDDQPDTMLHELVHAIQLAISALNYYFLCHHLGLGELLTELLGPPYKANEYTQCRRVDGSKVYVRPYFGKVYGANNEPLEVMAMAFQALLGSDDDLFFDFINKDRELACLTLGLLLMFRP